MACPAECINHGADSTMLKELTKAAWLSLLNFPEVRIPTVLILRGTRISTLVQAARQLVEQRNVTELTNRDRDLFLALLASSSEKPNKALRDAAARYRKHVGKKS